MARTKQPTHGETRMSRSHTAPPRLLKSTGPPHSQEMGGAEACNDASLASTPAAEHGEHSDQQIQPAAGGQQVHEHDEDSEQHGEIADSLSEVCYSCSRNICTVKSVILHENDTAAMLLVREVLRFLITAPRIQNHRGRRPRANFPMANPAGNIHSRWMAPKCYASGADYVKDS
jgi:hypothetical protein